MVIREPSMIYHKVERDATTKHLCEFTLSVVEVPATARQEENLYWKVLGSMLPGVVKKELEMIEECHF